MIDIMLEYIFYLGVLVLLAIPLGRYISKVMNGETVFLSKMMRPCEGFLYKVLGVKEEEEMSWKKYLGSVFAFSGIGLLVLWIIQMAQKHLLLNPQNVEGMSWDLSLNTAISFVTNTNWQAYSGESQLSYFSQLIGLTVQNFVSAATGIAVLYALIRGFTRVKQKGLGSFWVDLTRAVLYVLLPLSIVIAVGLMSQGVVQSGKAADTVQLLEAIAVDAEGNILKDAVVEENKVYVNGEVVENASMITEEVVPLGYAKRCKVSRGICW